MIKPRRGSEPDDPGSLRRAENPPDGLIVHVATKTADGVHVTDVWESEAAFEKFRDNQLVPAMQKFMAENDMPPGDSASAAGRGSF